MMLDDNFHAQVWPECCRETYSISVQALLGGDDGSDDFVLAAES